MALFGRARGGTLDVDDSLREGELLKALVDAVQKVDWPPPKIETWPEGREILDQEPSLRARIAVLTSRILAEGRARNRWSADQGEVMRHLLRRLLRSRLPLDESQLVDLLEDLRAPDGWDWDPPEAAILRAVEHYAEAHGLPRALRREAEEVLRSRGDHLAKANRVRLERILAPPAEEGGVGGLADDAWGRAVRADLEEDSGERRAAWQELLEIAAAAAGRTRPTKTWLRQSAGAVESIGAAEVARRVGAWTEGWKPGPVEDGEPGLGSANAELLRGLLWAAAPGGDARFASRVGRLAEVCFRKVSGHGPRSTRLGNGCLVALGLVGDHLGIAELSRLAVKVRYASARQMIESTLGRAAERAGMSREDLEDLGVPDHGLEPGGRARIPVGAGEAELAIENGDVVLRWHLSGRTTKGAPKALRESSAEAVREIRRRAKDIETTLRGQAGRIEAFYLADRELPGERWRRRFLDHPIVGTVARRLVWSLWTDDLRRTVLWREGELRDLDDRRIASGELAAGRVRLWHPVSATAEEVRRLRDLLREAEVTQPFPQAHREIYVLTDAERRTASYSNRFAAHVIRQHQFHALCQQRGWRYRLQGEFDSYNVPDRILPVWDLAVEFWVEPIAEHTTEMGIYSYLTTDQVRFRRAGGERLDLADVPELPFSELLRDVDLFTSVASVGNDPRWQDRGEGAGDWDDYWNGFAFGELNATAATRREVLARLVPRLKIADRCRLEDRFLVVRGDLRTYRIHLRSGHVLMEPNRQYLCIVADAGVRSKGPVVRLPFEGDSVLSLILSKAFLLAADTEIEDRTILSQIRARDP